MSNSVLEHIDQVDPVLRQVSRVLRPADPAAGKAGGQFVLTVPSEHFTSFLSISAALRRIGLDVAATAYEGWFNRISRHRHYDSPAVWHRYLEAAGLQVVRWQYYFSQGALRRLEWGHYLGLPSLVSKWLLGHWVIAPWRSSLSVTERWLRPFYEEPAPERGAYLFIVAQRILPDAAALPLPAPSPQEFRRELTPTEEIEATPQMPPPDVSEPSKLAVAQPAEPAASDADGSGVVAPPPSVRSLLWLGLALLLAVVGQVSWNWHERPFEPGDGLTWYGLALIAFAVFVWQSGSSPRGPAVGRDWLSRPFVWVRGRLFQCGLALTGLAFSWFAWIGVKDAVQPAGSASRALVLWVLGIVLAIFGLWPNGSDLAGRLWRRLRGQDGRPTKRASWSWPANLPDIWEPLLVAGLMMVALWIRYAGVERIPYVLAGDEASMGREAARVLSGELANPFITGWFSHPTLYFYLLALPVKLFGHTPFAVRFISPFVGTATVLAAYLFARRAWGRWVALVATVLLTGYHFHVHYSRLALNNIWDPLFALVVMGLLWQGRQRQDRRYFVFSGLALGVSQYYYMGSRLLLGLVAGMILHWLAVDRRSAWRQRSNIIALAVVFLVTVLPFALFAAGHPDDYMARMNQLGIFQSGWLEREVEVTGRSATSLLVEQLWKSALAFNYTLDPAFFYRPGIPLLRFAPSVLFVLGIGLALAGVKKTPNALLLLWIGGTVVFAGAMLENPPASQRYVTVAPAVCMVIAVVLVWIADRLRSLLGGRREAWLGASLLVAVWFSYGDLAYYFGDYTSNGDYGGLNTEVAHRVSDYLLNLGSEWRVFFFGPPRMGISRQGGFPSVPFLVPDSDTVDVREPLGDAAQLGAFERPVVCIFLPERAQEMAVIQSTYPGGTEKHFPGRFDRMLFLAYELPPKGIGHKLTIR